MYDTDNKRIAYANNAACKLWGAQDEAELTSRDLSKDMSRPVEKRLKQFQTDFEAGHAEFKETWTLYPNGVPETVDLVCTGFRMQDGRMATLCEVVGETVQTTENLRSIKALLHTDVLVALFSSHGLLLYQNPASRNIFQDTNRRLDSFFLHQKDYEACREILNKKEDFHQLVEAKTSKGERWYDLTIKHTLDPVAGQNAMLVTGIDVTNLKVMEADLSSNRKLLETTFLASQDAIIVINNNGLILEVNNCSEQIFGFKREDILGKDIADIIIPERYRSAHREGLERVRISGLSKPGGFRTEIEAMRVDGEEFMSELSISRIEKSDGDHFVAYIRDISEAKAAEKALVEAKIAAEHANEAKSNFLATMSHEIRTPMNGVLGMLDVLQRTELTETQRKHTDIINRSGHSLLRILSDILDFSKIESGEHELYLEPCNLHNVIEDSVELFHASASKKDITLKFNYAHGLPDQFIADANRIQQITSNLIGNAIKFTEKGHVFVKVTGENNGAHTNIKIDIEDTGIGIKTDKLTSIFDRFSQAESSTTRRFGGTGLGLSISRKLVEAMNGTLTVESEFGLGSKFSVQLPLNNHQVCAASVSAVASKLNDEQLNKKSIKSQSSISKTAPKFNFLIAANEEINQLVMTNFLKHPKISLTIANNRLEAIDACKLKKFNLIFMDISMPEMDGIETTQLIREQEKKRLERPTPIICITAHAMRDDRKKFLEAGASDYLSKPLQKNELIKVMSRWLKTSKIHDAA